VVCPAAEKVEPKLRAGSIEIQIFISENLNDTFKRKKKLEF
jgi:hypothetical protein